MVRRWPHNVPLLVSGLRWHPGVEEGVTLMNDTPDSIPHCWPLPPMANQAGVLDLFAGIGTWAAAAASLGLPLLGSLDWDKHAISALQQQGHTTLQLDFGQPRQWGPALATTPRLITASPPCQPWTTAGRQGGYHDPRAVPMVLLPVFASWTGADAVCIEQVPALQSHDGGASWTLWKHLWAAAGYRTHTALFEAHDLLPITRRRLMVWAWRTSGGDLDARLAEAILRSRAILPNRCPFARFFLWLGSADPELRLTPAILGMYAHPDLLPWPAYDRLIVPGRPVGVIMRAYGRAHEIDGRHLVAKGLHGQLVDDNGLRLLHPGECRALMALPRFHADNYTIAWQLVGNALPGTFATRCLGCWLHVRHGANIDVAGMLLALVRRTQADFALATPAGMWCSNAHAPLCREPLTRAGPTRPRKPIDCGRARSVS